MGEGQTIDEAIGHNVRSLRTRASMTQSELGEHLGFFLDRPWPAQTVSLAEKGRRPYSVAELVALAEILDVKIGDLLNPTQGTKIALPSGNGMKLTSYLHRVAPSETPTGKDVESIREELTQIVAKSAEIGGFSEGLREHANKIWRLAYHLENPHKDNDDA